MKQMGWLLTGIGIAALFGASGCTKTPPEAPANASEAGGKPAAAAKTARVEQLTAAQMAESKPNEAGVVPILEYHDVVEKEASMRRSTANFRHDLERLYKEGYRPVSLTDYLNNRIATPLGKSPVIVTFDDARESQFRYLPDGSVDPNCAVGIMQAFQKEHPDFIIKATFYVLPTQPGFGQPELRAKKMQALLDWGYEIGNHTITHTALRTLSDSDVRKELAGCVVETRKLAPKAQMETIALPLGIAPRNRTLLVSGEFGGTKYANRAALLVGANPAPSPVSPKFVPMRLPRIQATEGDAGITYWLDDLARHPEHRYVSDGDPNTVTVPKSKEDKVDASKLQGATLRTY